MTGGGVGGGCGGGSSYPENLRSNTRRSRTVEAREDRKIGHERNLQNARTQKQIQQNMMARAR